MAAKKQEVVTELTSKWIKAAQGCGCVTFIIFSAIGAAIGATATRKGEMLPMWFFGIAFIGAAVYLGARVQAWWEHG